MLAFKHKEWSFRGHMQRLDKFVYDPNKSASTVAIQATRGSFRFVTGSQGTGAVQVKTPYGTLGVRG